MTHTHTKKMTYTLIQIVLSDYIEGQEIQNYTAALLLSIFIFQWAEQCSKRNWTHCDQRIISQLTCTLTATTLNKTEVWF